MKLVVKDLTDQFIGLPVEHPLRSRIDEGNPPPRVHQEQTFRRIVGDRLHQPELTPGLLLRLEPFSDINATSGITRELTIQTEARLAAVEHPAPNPIVPT